MRESEPKEAAVPLLSRARVPLLATLAIVVSAVAIWQGGRRGATRATQTAEPAQPPPVAPAAQDASAGRVAAEQEALRQFIAGLERMLASAAHDDGRPGEGAPGLPLPEHLKDAPRDRQLGYYQQLLEHGEGMLELNRPQMSETQLAEAENVLGRLRERLGGVGDAGSFPRTTPGRGAP